MTVWTSFQRRRHNPVPAIVLMLMSILRGILPFFTLVVVLNNPPDTMKCNMANMGTWTWCLVYTILGLISLLSTCPYGLGICESTEGACVSAFMIDFLFGVPRMAWTILGAIMLWWQDCSGLFDYPLNVMVAAVIMGFVQEVFLFFFFVWAVCHCM